MNKILETLDNILNQKQELPSVKVEIETTSVIKACAIVLAMLVVFLVVKKLI